jgi:hypothetical protein
MEDNLDSVARYRERANELRMVAGDMSENDSRKTMLEIAEDYERLARSLQLLHNRHPDPSDNVIAHAGNGLGSRSRPAPDYNSQIYWQKFTP